MFLAVDRRVAHRCVRRQSRSSWATTRAALDERRFTSDASSVLPPASSCRLTMAVSLLLLSTSSYTSSRAHLGQIEYVLLVSRQGKVRLAKWFVNMQPKQKSKIVKDVTQLVLARRTRMCNFLEYKDSKVVYRRYASLFFVTGIGPGDNELIALEVIHRCAR